MGKPVVVGFLGRIQIDFQLKFFQKLGQRSRALFEAVADLLGAIMVLPLFILGGRPWMIQKPAVFQPAGSLVPGVRKFGTENGGISQTDFSPFQRVVVQEGDCVHADVHVFDQRPQVVGFRLPVDLPKRNVLAFEQHAGMLIKDRPGVLFAVFAAQAQNDARLVLLDEEFLKIALMRADDDAGGPVFSDDALPEGAVAIHHQSFNRFERKCVDGPDKRRGKRGKIMPGKRNRAERFSNRFVILGHRIPAIDLGISQNRHARNGSQRL